MTTEEMIPLTLLALSACISAAMSTQDSSMICLGQPQTFSCEVPKQGSLTRLEWRIDFEGSSSEASVTRQFISTDPVGHILRGNRSGVSFVFNLTSKSSSNLVSVMTVTVNDINVTALINNATVNCGETNPKVFRIIEGPPSSIMNLTHDRMKVQWNLVTMADHYIISVSPLSNDNESDSTLMTSNTTIQLPLQYNRVYNITVMAGNCAGNSTPAEISVRVGHCTLSTSKFGNINFKNDSSSGYMEGSWILFYCYDNRNEPIVATCMKNGSWSPDPHTYKCQNNETKEVTSSQQLCTGMLVNVCPLPSCTAHVDVRIASLTTSLLVFAILMFLTGFMLGTLLMKYILKTPKKDSVVLTTVPSSVSALYEEIQPPSSSGNMGGQEVMKIKDNEAYGCIQGQ